MRKFAVILAAILTLATLSEAQKAASAAAKLTGPRGGDRGILSRPTPAAGNLFNLDLAAPAAAIIRC